MGHGFFYFRGKEPCGCISERKGVAYGNRNYYVRKHLAEHLHVKSIKPIHIRTNVCKNS